MMKVLASLILVVCCSCGVLSTLCPAGWVLRRATCYGFSNQQLEWAEAQAACEGYGGHLAVIKTRNEGSFLENLARSRGGSYWIGATDIFSEGVFSWITTGRQIQLFSDWAAGQPDNAGLNENCAEISGLFGYKWNDAQCTKTSNFICESKGIIG